MNFNGQSITLEITQGVEMGSKEGRMLIDRCNNSIAQILLDTKVVHLLHCTCKEAQLLKWLAVHNIATSPSPADKP